MDILKSYGGEQPDFEEAAPLTDTELAARVRAGNNDAFAELWLRHERSIAHVANQAGATHNNREDFVQGTAEKLLRDLQNHDRDFDNPGGARNFAARLVRNSMVDEHRRPRTKREELCDDFYDTAVPVHEAAESTATRNLSRLAAIRLLQAALAELPPEQAEALTITYLSDESREEYFQRTGVTVNTLGTRVFKAKQKLRRRSDLRQLFDALGADE